MTNKDSFSDQDRIQRSNSEEHLTERTNDANNVNEYSAGVDQNGVDQDTVSARPATQDEVAYRNGYVQGQQREQIHDDIQRTREENSAAAGTGVIVGVIIASIAGLVLAALYFMPQNRQPVPVPAASPAQPQSSPTQPQTTNRTTIIERERVREVPSTPQDTEVIITPSSPQPQPVQPTVQPTVQPSVTPPNATQPAPNTVPSQVTPDSTTTSPNSTITSPVDPNQSLSQPSVTPSQPGGDFDGAGTTGQ